MFAKLKSNSLLTGSAVYIFANLLAAAFPFILLPILTRYLSPAEYGEVAMFQVLLSALAAFVGLNAVGAAGREYYDHDPNPSEFKAYMGSCFQVLAASSLLVFLLMFLFLQEISQLVSLNKKWVLLSVAVAATGFVIQMRLGLWQVKKSAVPYGILQVSQSFGITILSLLLVLDLTQGAAGRINAQVYGTLLFAGVSLYLLRNEFWALMWRPDQIREILHFGLPLIPHVSGIFLLSFFDRFVINSKLGLAETGVYMVAVQLASAMGIVFDAVNKAYVPWLYERLKRNKHTEKNEIVSWTYAYFIIVLLVAGLAFLIGPYLTVLIAGENYAEAGTVVGWLALGQAFSGMYQMVTNYTFYARKTGLLSLCTIVSGLLNIGLLILLIEMFGLVGAGMAFAISMAARFLLTWFVAQKCHPMPWFHFFKNI